MSTIKTKKVQVGTDSTASNNFTIYTPGTPDGTVRIGNGNADSVTDAITLDSSGNITAAQNLTVSGDLSVTGSVPANTGPAFSAYLSANQSVSNTTFTKLQIDTENFDTNSNYDNTTNYRFTPTVAGYYQVGGAAKFIGLGDNDVFIVAIYKNGSLFRRGIYVSTGGAMSPVATVSSLVYLNGSTDYIELYAYHNYGSAIDVGSDDDNTRFEAVLVRAA